VENTVKYKPRGSEQVPKQVQGFLKSGVEAEAAEPTTTWSLARCPALSSDKLPEEVSLTSTQKAAVVCCFADSDEPIKMKRKMCNPRKGLKTYKDALRMCKRLGKKKNGKPQKTTLCTRKQMEDGVQCDSGCGRTFNKKRFWSLAPGVVPPDEFGCTETKCGCTESGTTALGGKLKVRKLCLPEKIAGPLYNNVYRGPISMHAVADRTQCGVAYFSWTSDRPYGKSTADGRVYVSKLSIADGVPTLQGSAFFDGFVRSGGIDITETGTLGTLCAKYVPSWVQACEGGGDDIGNCPLALAVCEVDAATMKVKDTPWRIGKQYQLTDAGSETGIWGSYAIQSWFAERSAGTGYLVYAPKSRQWTAWYGAMIGSHTGYAMHTYAHDAAPLSKGISDAFAHPLPIDEIAHRQETLVGPFADHNRRGTGDHQAGAAWHYHSGLGDIGLMKHNHGTVYMQQYGLVEPKGNFATEVDEKGRHAAHSTGRLELTYNDDDAVLEGGLRQCGEDWILALVTKQNGNVCAKVSKGGVIQKWVSIEASVGLMPCSPSGGNCGDGRKGGLTRIAPLGTPEAKTCGSAARFLFGYEKEDRSRWLVEVDGDCKAKESSREDVTQHTTWPTNQDWTTTADGAVVWVTSWTLDGRGSPNSVATYPSSSQNSDPNAEYRFSRTPDATNEAEVTVYLP